MFALNASWHFRVIASSDASCLGRMKMLISDLLAYSQVGTRGREFELIDCDAVLDQAVTNLQLTILEKVGVVTERLGDSSGQLTHLSDV